MTSVVLVRLKSQSQIILSSYKNTYTWPLFYFKSIIIVEMQVICILIDTI